MLRCEWYYLYFAIVLFNYDSLNRCIKKLICAWHGVNRLLIVLFVNVNHMYSLCMTYLLDVYDVNNKFAQSNLGTGPRRGSCARRRPA